MIKAASINKSTLLKRQPGAFYRPALLQLWLSSTLISFFSFSSPMSKLLLFYRSSSTGQGLKSITHIGLTIKPFSIHIHFKRPSTLLNSCSPYTKSINPFQLSRKIIHKFDLQKASIFTLGMLMIFYLGNVHSYKQFYLLEEGILLEKEVSKILEVIKKRYSSKLTEIITNMLLN